MIPEKETLTVEFKSDIRNLPDSEIFDAVVAFANTDGGDIYLGVENNGEVTGLHETHRNPITLSAYIANNTVPPISVRTEVLDGEKQVLRISVPKSHGGIAATASGKILRRRIKLDGTPENIPMYPTEISTRLSSLRLLDYSAMLVNDAAIDDFDPLETERLRKSISAYSGDKLLLELQDDELFKAMGFVRESEGRLIPTITGLLMIGRKRMIEMHIPTHQASFQVLEGSNVKVNEDISLPLLALIERLIDFTNVRNTAHEFEIGSYRMSIPDFDKRAVREAIVNAFSHRDYTKMGRVRVCIADEGLRIANPGGFIEGVTINSLLTAEPQGRNPLLSDALKRVGLAERTGRGIDRIFEGSLLYGKQPPDYSASTATTVSLLIPRCAYDPQITRLVAKEQSRTGRPFSIHMLLVLKALQESPGSSVRQLSAATNFSETVIRTLLENAIVAGLAEEYGSGRSRTYILKRESYGEGNNTTGYLRQTDIYEPQHPEMILSLASSRDYISRADVMSLLHVTGPEAYRALKKLADAGKLEPINKGRYAKYRLHTCGAKVFVDT